MREKLLKLARGESESESGPDYVSSFLDEWEEGVANDNLEGAILARS